MLQMGLLWCNKHFRLALTMKYHRIVSYIYIYIFLFYLTLVQCRDPAGHSPVSPPRTRCGWRDGGSRPNDWPHHSTPRFRRNPRQCQRWRAENRKCQVLTQWLIQPSDGINVINMDEWVLTSIHALTTRAEQFIVFLTSTPLSACVADCGAGGVWVFTNQRVNGSIPNPCTAVNWSKSPWACLWFWNEWK